MLIYFDSQHEMYCNEILKKIVILMLLMIMADIQQIVATKQRQLEIPEEQNNQTVIMAYQIEGSSGDLYNIFKKRLQVITNELAYHTLNDLQQQPSTKDLEKPTSDGSDFKYFNLTDSQLIRSINSKRKNGKRSSVRRQEIFDLYRKLNNDSPFDSEQVVGRSGRSFFNWFRKESKDNKTNLSHNPKPSDQVLKMSTTINEDNGNFTKLLDILKQESNPTNFIANRDTLNQEFQKQMKIINNVITPLETRFYRQALYFNQHFNHNDQNWLQDEDSYENINWDFDNPNKDYEYWNFLPKKATESLNHRRRQVATCNANANTNAVYPSVLTKALEISLSPSVHTNSSGSLLSKVAQQMNTSTLDLAEKLAKSTDSTSDGNLSKMVQNFMTNDPDQIPITKDYKPITFQGPSTSAPVQTGTADNVQASSKNVETSNGLTTSSLTNILDRVLSKLESIHDGKSSEDEIHPDGAPCDIVGSWSSVTLGLCFDIKLNKDKLRNVSPAEINNKLLLIDAQECTPQRAHQIVDVEWKFGGSALKTMGGPFYIYAQKRNESLVGTFLGYCRTCRSIDTIFGAWTFSSPSKNYYDISLAFDVKRDLLRRDRMEIKRKDRFKDLLYQNRIGKLRRR